MIERMQHASVLSISERFQAGRIAASDLASSDDFCEIWPIWL
jgi:hypothetical protein